MESLLLGRFPSDLEMRTLGKKNLVDARSQGEPELLNDRPACSAVPEPGSVTRWIGAYRTGQTTDARLVWDRYFVRLRGLARRIFGQASLPRIVADEEDAAVGAFASFCSGLRRGRFPGVAGRHELSRLLRHITKCHALKLGERERRGKRGAGRLVAEADLSGRETGLASLDELAGRERGPESELLHAEETQRLLDLLQDEKLRQIAIWLREGYSVKEIAQRAGCSQSLVRIRLAVIRRRLVAAAQSGERTDEP
jgi:DNA-directed RNA polymerase specialized sigma24 family protein